MPESAFVVQYDGPGLADNSIDVRTLAPALLSLASLFRQASATVYPGEEPVRLEVRATEPGSFIVDLNLVQADLARDLVHIFSSETAVALENMKDLILAPVIGLIAFIAHRRNRRMTRENVLDETTRITFEDGESFVVPDAMLMLFDRVEYRRLVYDVVAPLATSQVDVIRFSRGTDVDELVVTDDDLPAFSAPPSEPVVLVDSIVPVVLSVISPNFNPEQHWRLSRSGASASIQAVILDEVFLARVQNGQETFRRGDMISCELHSTQTRDDDGLHEQHEVVHVYKHLHEDDPMDHLFED